VIVPDLVEESAGEAETDAIAEERARGSLSS
jgi:hypothetical protein